MCVTVRKKGDLKLLLVFYASKIPDTSEAVGHNMFLVIFSK